MDPIDGDASQEMRVKVLDGTEAGELSSASTEVLDDKSMQEVVDQSELIANAPVISKTDRGGD